MTLKEFMENLHNISKEVYDSDQDFYTRRGIKIRSMEITRYSCAEQKTRVILEKIIQETTNRLNRLSQAESENEVSMFTTQGRIAQETLKTQLLQIQHEQQEIAAKSEGTAKAKKAAASAKASGNGEASEWLQGTAAGSEGKPRSGRSKKRS